MIFGGVSVPFLHKSNGETGDGGSGFYEILLNLRMVGDTKPIPEESLSSELRSFTRRIRVECYHVKAHIFQNPTGSARLVGDFDWSRRHLCNADFRH